MNQQQEARTQYLQLESFITIIKSSFKMLHTIPFNNVEERIARYGNFYQIHDQLNTNSKQLEKLGSELTNEKQLSESKIQQLCQDMNVVSQQLFNINQAINDSLRDTPSKKLQHSIQNAAVVSNVLDPKLSRLRYQDETHHLKMLFNPVKPAPRPDKDNPDQSQKNTDNSFKFPY